jgi:HK97 family phage portal protein
VLSFSSSPILKFIKKVFKKPGKQISLKDEGFLNALKEFTLQQVNNIPTPPPPANLKYPVITIKKAAGNGLDDQAPYMSGNFKGSFTDEGYQKSEHPMKLFFKIHELHDPVRTCVKSIVNACIRTGYEVISAAGMDDPYRHRIETFLKNVNPNQTFIDLLKEQLTDFEICENSMMRIAFRADGYIKYIYRLPPDTVYIKADEYGMVQGYKQKVDGLNDITFEADEVIHIKGVNPLNALFGLSKLFTLMSPVLQYAYAQKYNQLFFQQGGRGGKIFSQDAGPETLKRNRDVLRNEYSGLDKMHRLILLGKEGGKGVDLVYNGDKNPVEMGFQELRKTTKQSIFELYGVLPEVIGSHERGPLGGDVTDQSWELFLKITVYPLLESFYAEFTRKFIHQKLGLPWITVRPKLKEALWDKAQALAVYHVARTGIETINGLRKGLGLPPIPGGDILVMLTNDGLMPVDWFIKRQQAIASGVVNPL